MFKPLLASLTLTTAIVTGLALSTEAPSAIAGTCASNCGSSAIQFTPGQRIRVQVQNRTNVRLRVEQVVPMEPISLAPGQEVELNFWEGTISNVSLLFWGEQGELPLRVIASQPNAETLRVELIGGSQPPGDRSVYVLNDGRVLVE